MPKTKLGVVPTQSMKNEQHGRVTAQSIGGYDGRRAGCALPSVQKVKNLGDLILPEWSSALDITNELHRLWEAVDDHSLNQSWFSTHARVDGTVMMVTTPEILRVSQSVFAFIALSLWLIVMHFHCGRIFCGQSLVVSMLLILIMRQTA